MGDGRKSPVCVKSILPLLGILAAAVLVSCTVRTYYVKRPYQAAVSGQIGSIAWIMPAHQEDIDYSFSCIDDVKLKNIIDEDYEFRVIKHDTYRGNIEDAALKATLDDHIACSEVARSAYNESSGGCAPRDSKPLSRAELLNPTTSEFYKWLALPKDFPTWQACLDKLASQDENGRDLCNLPGSDTDDRPPHIDYQPFNDWAFLARRMLCENQGLFGNWSGWSPHDLTIDAQVWWLPHDRQVAAALRPESYVALLALSARPPGSSGGKEGFAALPERAQAALINYAGSEGKDADSASTLVKSLGKDGGGSFSSQQKVDLTISGAVDSASTRDRFDYLTAYLSIPPLAGRLNGRISLERELLRRFAELYYARSPDDRSDGGIIESDMRTAADELTVHIEAIDTIATQSTLINLGTLTTAASLTASGGTPPTAPLAASGQAQLSSTRVENIAKELDRRAVWLSRERTTMRITQRGMMEATIAGSIVTQVTLSIPVSSMYVLEVSPVKEEDDSAASGKANSGKDSQKKKTAGQPAKTVKAPKPVKVQLTEIGQPLYREVDAMNGLIATTRIETPAGIGNFYDLFQKAPDGDDFTVLQGPAPLKLWENKRNLSTLELSELVDLDLKPDDPRSYSTVAIWSTAPYARQVATFQGEKEDDFLAALHDGKIGLAERNADGASWYRLVSCGTKSDRNNAQATSSEHRPAPGQVWLGLENGDGIIGGFSDDISLGDIYRCCRPIAGAVNPCATKGKKP